MEGSNSREKRKAVAECGQGGVTGRLPLTALFEGGYHAIKEEEGRGSVMHYIQQRLLGEKDHRENGLCLRARGERKRKKGVPIPSRNLRKEGTFENSNESRGN